jgi:hypothetical protein
MAQVMEAFWYFNGFPDNMGVVGLDVDTILSLLQYSKESIPNMNVHLCPTETIFSVLSCS